MSADHETTKAMSAAELDRHVADARAQFEAAYAQFELSRSPHDREAAIQFKEVFEAACRERRARAGDESFAAIESRSTDPAK